MTQQRPPTDSETEPHRIAVFDGGTDKDWDSFLAGLDSNHHLQSSLWAQVKSLNGWTSKRIIASKVGQIVGGAQLLVRNVRYLGPVGYIPKGPILIGGHDLLVDELLKRILEIAKSERIRVLFVQPPEHGKLSDALAGHGFKPSPVETAPSATIQLDATEDLDVILSRMSKGMRNQIRRSQRRGITVREGIRDDLPVFHQLLTATSQRRKFSVFDLDYFHGMWDVFEPVGGIKLFIAELNGEAVTAQICIAFGDTVIAKQIGWSGKYGKLHPNEALDWFTIRWVKENGYRCYDLEGIERPVAEALVKGELPPEKYANGPTAYKLRLGGKAALKPQAYCFVTNPIFRSLYSQFGCFVASRPFVQKAAGRFRTG